MSQKPLDTAWQRMQRSSQLSEPTYADIATRIHSAYNHLFTAVKEALPGSNIGQANPRIRLTDGTTYYRGDKYEAAWVKDPARLQLVRPAFTKLGSISLEFEPNSAIRKYPVQEQYQMNAGGIEITATLEEMAALVGKQSVAVSVDYPTKH